MGQPPRVAVLSASLDESSAGAASIDIALQLSNPNDDPLPLIEFEYTVSLDGKQVYDGRRAALATLSKGSERTLTVPAVIIYEHTGWRAGSGAQPLVGISGTLRYRTPGTFADLLFDFGVRKPKVRFSGEQVLTSAPAELSSITTQ
jgi:hypothetical protein